MPIAADASPLILFARAGLLPVLRDAVSEVWIPPAVSYESFRGNPSRSGAAELLNALRGWLHEAAPSDQRAVAALAAEVDRGEAEAIVLAHEHGLLLLIDDRAGRRAAEALGVPVIGSAGMLSLAKQQGLLPLVRPALDDLLRVGLRLSDSLYRQILVDAREG